MDLIIKNASLDEVTAICYRIGEPNFQERVESERKFGAVEYMVNHNVDLNTAEKTYDNDLENTKNQVAMDSDETEISKTVQKKVEEQPEPVQEELHLDKPPEASTTPAVNLKDSLHQLGTNLVNSGKSKEFIQILNSFGANSLPELNKNHYEAALEKMKAIQNG